MKITNPFVQKSVQASDEPGNLWPSPGSGVHQHLSRNGFINYMLFTNTPTWQSLIGIRSLFECYHRNPVLFSTIMIKAREYSNMRIKVVNKRTGFAEKENTRKDIPAKLYALFNKPNVLQSRWEFFLQRKIFEEVAGNSFTYGNFAMGMQGSINNISALWNVWPEHMKYKLSGNYFEATKLDDIISEWRFELGAYKKSWKPFEIMHKNKPNTNASDGLIFGRATAASLSLPLSNIEIAYESRNVIMKNRGMRALVTSDRSDASGNTPLLADEKEIVKEELKGYGTMEHQSQFLFSSMPLKVQTIDQDVAKLGLFEELSTDAMIVANAFGVPEVLLKLYIKGATFENQEASVRRLYQGTLIPEAEDDMIALSSFLGLDETEWRIEADFSHVAALQESEKAKAETQKVEKATAMEEVKLGLITNEEYRERMGYGKMPKTETTDDNETDTEETDSEGDQGAEG